MIDTYTAVLHGPAFFRITPSNAMVDHHLERGGMPLHDAVGVNGERGATTENEGAWCGLRGV